MVTTTTAPPQRRHIRAYQVSDQCEHCGARMLYHDYDPHYWHDGLTCLMCAREQTLTTGAKSLIDPQARPRRRHQRSTRWERN